MGWEEKHWRQEHQWGDCYYSPGEARVRGVAWCNGTSLGTDIREILIQMLALPRISHVTVGKPLLFSDSIFPKRIRINHQIYPGTAMLSFFLVIEANEICTLCPYKVWLLAPLCHFLQGICVHGLGNVNKCRYPP